MKGIGIVAIGRNEGARLRRCLASVLGQVEHVVYVDSGSSDGSQAAARAMGAEVAELALSTPFTAARARNAGLEKLLEKAPETAFVQFVDGDCELAPQWLRTGLEEIEARRDVAAVSGRLMERFPEASVYNRLCDVEWNTPVGETRSCGGNALMRVEAVRACNGFHEGLIAGEEPELCFRMRARGWKILRINAPMGWHDAAMTRFGQWWRRNVRTGHAFAEGALLHGRSPERYCVRETASIMLWGAVLPMIVITAALPTHGLSLLLLLAYAVQWIRIHGHMRRRRFTNRESAAYAFFCVLGKLPQALGVLRCRLARMLRTRPQLIEYK